MPRKTLFAAAIVCLLTLRTACLEAGYIQAFSGNTKASTTGSATMIGDFAVLDRLTGASTTGDVFGTGFSGFDTVASIDTTARYLYLYQIVPNVGGFTSFALGDQNVRFAGVTSTAEWDLQLADNAGPATSSNAFGFDGATFMQEAPANTGVTDPQVVTPTSSLLSGTISTSPTTFQVSFSGFAGNQVSDLFGFTTNAPPAFLTPVPATPTYASGTFVAPVPEPSSGCLLFVGIVLVAALIAGRKRHHHASGARTAAPAGS